MAKPGSETLLERLQRGDEQALVDARAHYDAESTTAAAALSMRDERIRSLESSLASATKIANKLQSAPSSSSTRAPARAV